MGYKLNHRDHKEGLFFSFVLFVISVVQKKSQQHDQTPRVNQWVRDKQYFTGIAPPEAFMEALNLYSKNAGLTQPQYRQKYP